MIGRGDFARAHELIAAIEDADWKWRCSTVLALAEGRSVALDHPHIQPLPILQDLLLAGALEAAHSIQEHKKVASSTGFILRAYLKKGHTAKAKELLLLRSRNNFSVKSEIFSSRS